MAFLSSLNISGSALTAQKYRMDVLSQNIANKDTVTEGKAYRRKLVLLSERKSSFNEDLKKAEKLGGVEVSGVAEDKDSVKLEYDPENPLANDEG
jgi:flagellar basal-body rod protein FlgC